MLLLWVQLAACRTTPPPSAAPANDGGNGDLAGRMVVDEFTDAAFKPGGELPPVGATVVTKDAGMQVGSSDVQASRDGISGGETAPGACNAVAQDCGAMKGCYPTPESGGAMCFVPGAVAKGAACTAHTDCAAGLLCVETYDAGSVCARICDKSRNDGCSGGETCRGYSGPIGFCAL